MGTEGFAYRSDLFPDFVINLKLEQSTELVVCIRPSITSCTSQQGVVSIVVSGGSLVGLWWVSGVVPFSDGDFRVDFTKRVIGKPSALLNQVTQDVRDPVMRALQGQTRGDLSGVASQPPAQPPAQVSCMDRWILQLARTGR